MTSADETPSPAGEDRPTSKKSRRTWPERLAVLGTFVAAFVCFAVAAVLIGGYQVARQRNLADFQNPADLAAAAADASTAPPLIIDMGTADTSAGSLAPPTTADATDETGATPTTAAAGGTTTSAGAEATEGPEMSEPASTTGGPTTVGVAPPPTSPIVFPEADPDAQNFLITGADNGACIAPDSPYASVFGDREGMGERSDTIMVLRVDPDASRVAILSFPRDLYVEIAGSGNMSRINSAYERNEPQRLADTIFENFGVPIDHYIQVDFCAFKTLVDAVGGVAVPFEFPARDDNTGLNVPTTGCFTFDGEQGLAYVRSRHYQYEDPPGSGEWSTDQTFDLGRISRQQDFLRRTLSSLLDKGPLNPRVARGLIRAATEYITTDPDLTYAKMLEFAGVMNDVDPASILTYQVEATPRTIGGAAVLIPTTDSENMQEVLALFTGETSLSEAPEQVFEQTTTAAPRGSTTTIAAGTTSASEPVGSDSTDPTFSAAADGTDTTIGGEPTDTGSTGSMPVDGPQENEFGIVPPRDVVC